MVGQTGPSALAPYIRDMAEEEYQDLAQGSVEPKIRVCLNCRNPFDSTWAGERICKVCKSREAWRTGGSNMAV